MSSPRTIHQIWIGPDPVPRHWTDTWRTEHPRWNVRLWREPHIDTLMDESPSRHQYDTYMAMGCWNGAANVARATILYTWGGVYVDADLECLRPLDGHAWIDHPMWVSRSANNPSRPANGAMGCAPGHRTMGQYEYAISKVGDALTPSWRATGAELLQKVIAEAGKPVTWVDSGLWYPTKLSGAPNPAWRQESAVAVHHAYTTGINSMRRRIRRGGPVRDG